MSEQINMQFYYKTELSKFSLYDKNSQIYFCFILTNVA